MALSVPLYTVDDLARFPDDGNRYELLNGVLLVTPAPAAVHQLVASRIQTRLSVALALTGHAHVVGPGTTNPPPPVSGNTSSSGVPAIASPTGTISMALVAH